MWWLFVRWEIYVQIVVVITMSIIMFNIAITQICIRIWSNALFSSRGNQMDIAQITILQLLFTNQINSNQIKCWFFIRGENWSTQGKTSHGRVENQQTQSTYDTQCRNRTGPHWWKANALTTRPTLRPQVTLRLHKIWPQTSWCNTALFLLHYWPSKDWCCAQYRVPQQASHTLPHRSY